MILAIVVVCLSTVITAQENAYVAAESGLSLRDQPDITGKVLSKLPYGEAIGVLEKTDEKLVIIDGGKTISGEWVKVETRTHVGYVFNGYLSPNKIGKTITINLDDVNLEIKNVVTRDYKRTHDLKEEDTAIIHVDVNDTPEEKNIVLINNNYKHVSLFQRYENSFSFMSADAQCDSNEWKRIDTEWKPLKQLKTNTFKTLSYTEKDWLDFVEMATKDVQKDIIDKCGEDWFSYVNTIDNMKDFPVSVSTNRVLIKLILTDFEDHITEKIIEFEMPNN